MMTRDEFKVAVMARILQNPEVADVSSDDENYTLCVRLKSDDKYVVALDKFHGWQAQDHGRLEYALSTASQLFVRATPDRATDRSKLLPVLRRRLSLSGLLPPGEKIPTDGVPNGRPWALGLMEYVATCYSDRSGIQHRVPIGEVDSLRETAYANLAKREFATDELDGAFIMVRAPDDDLETEAPSFFLREDALLEFHERTKGGFVALVDRQLAVCIPSDGNVQMLAEFAMCQSATRNRHLAPVPELDKPLSPLIFQIEKSGLRPLRGGQFGAHEASLAVRKCWQAAFSCEFNDRESEDDLARVLLHPGRLPLFFSVWTPGKRYTEVDMIAFRDIVSQVSVFSLSRQRLVDMGILELADPVDGYPTWRAVRDLSPAEAQGLFPEAMVKDTETAIADALDDRSFVSRSSLS